MKPGEELSNPITGQMIRCVELTPEALVLESSYRPSSRRPPPHRHPRQRERFEVLEGAVRATVVGKTKVLERGDTLVIEPGVAHELTGDAERAGTVRWETRPPLRTAELIETSFRLAQDGRVSERTGVPGLLQLAATLREYDDVFVLVRPARPIQQLLFALLAPLARSRGIGASYPG